jgi:hypothetical protein
MQLLVLASYRFWNGFTDWFITIQLENPRFMEDKSHLTGCTNYHDLGSGSTHAHPVLTLKYEIVSYNANDSA